MSPTDFLNLANAQQAKALLGSTTAGNRFDSSLQPPWCMAACHVAQDNQAGFLMIRHIESGHYFLFGVNSQHRKTIKKYLGPIKGDELHRLLASLLYYGEFAGFGKRQDGYTYTAIGADHVTYKNYPHLKLPEIGNWDWPASRDALIPAFKDPKDDEWEIAACNTIREELKACKQKTS